MKKYLFYLLISLIIFLFLGQTASFAHQNATNTCLHIQNQYVECCGANYCSGSNLVNDCSTYYYTGPTGYPADLADHTFFSSSTGVLHQASSAQCVPSCTPDGSCNAPTPACGQTTFGTDNCGNSCSKTGPACTQPVTIGGWITNSSTSGGISGISVTVARGDGQQTLSTTDANGHFQVDNLISLGQTYAVRAPSALTGFSSRTPSTDYENQTAGGTSDCRTNCNFQYTPQTFTIGGRVTNFTTAVGIQGVIINQGVSTPPNCNIGTATTDLNGNYSFNNVAYNLFFCLRPPSLSGYTGPSPTSYENQTATANKTDYNFSYTASENPVLVVRCSVQPTVAIINQQVTWTADITGGTPNFTYSWTGSDNLSNITSSTSSITNSVPKTYTTSGSKTATVTVTDSSSPVQSKSASCSVVITAPPPTVTLTANPTSIANNTSSTLSWTTTDCTTANSCSCTASGDWSGLKSISGGSQSTGNLPGPALYTYTLTCTNNNGSSLPSTATVSVGGAPCTAETDAAFCTRLGKNCGSVTASDNCGTIKTVSCGTTCPSGQTCGGGGTPNVCGGSSSSPPPPSTSTPTPTATPTPTPSGLRPWIQTTGGDVHSNTNINTPGGP